jgi:predicted RNA binding protein YcfA (HicA-like mRNA interferase family)
VRKQADLLLRQIKRAGCVLVRHGGNHDIYANPANGRRSSVPRHRQIADGLYHGILKDLGLDE